MLKEENYQKDPVKWYKISVGYLIHVLKDFILPRYDKNHPLVEPINEAIEMIQELENKITFSEKE